MDSKEKEVIQWDNWLLEAVRKIRTQKQRPGLDRIYNAVRLLAEKQELAEHSIKSPIAPIYHVQFNQIKIEQVQRHLDRAVKKGLLLKVYSKGLATYKAVEKSERTLNLSKGQDISGELSKCILKVIRELSECDAPVPTSSSVTVSSLSGNKPVKVGYTFDTIEEYVRHSHVIIYPDECAADYLQNLVRQALHTLCGRGKLELVSGEHYRLPASHGNNPSTPGGASTPGSGSSSKQKLSSISSSTASNSNSSNNSNSSWSSNASNSNPSTATATAPTTFSGNVAPSPGTLIKKDSGSGLPLPSTAKGKLKEGTPPSSSPPRGNLPGDLSEAEEIALVTEQTARAVKLVMKDRRPGEKPPAQKKAVITASNPNNSNSNTSPPHNPQDLEKREGQGQVVVVANSSGASASNNNSSNSSSSSGASAGGSGSSDEDSSRKSPPADPPPKASGGQQQQQQKNGNKAVIKLMVPAFPGRNGNNGNGNNGNNGGNGSGNKNSSGNGNGKSSSSSSSTPLGKGVSPSASPPPQEVDQKKEESPMPKSNISSSAEKAQKVVVAPVTSTSTTQGKVEVSTSAAAPNLTKSDSKIIGCSIKEERKGLCLICGIHTRNPDSPEIVRDLRYSGMIQHYFTTLGMDVKPEKCSEFDLCTTCFRQLEHFQEVQETLIFFENYRDKVVIDLFKEQRKRKHDEDNEFGWIHQEIKKLHGGEASRSWLKVREEQIKLTLEQYEYEVSDK